MNINYSDENIIKKVVKIQRFWRKNIQRNCVVLNQSKLEHFNSQTNINLLEKIKKEDSFSENFFSTSNAQLLSSSPIRVQKNKILTSHSIIAEHHLDIVLDNSEGNLQVNQKNDNKSNKIQQSMIPLLMKTKKVNHCLRFYV